MWRRPQLLFVVAGTALITNVVTSAIKLGVGRDRPPFVDPEPEPLVGVPETASFPSGHASTSFACATVLARAAPRFTVPLYALAAAVAFSRVYVGVHYPLDALAGAVLGVLAAIALLRLEGGLRRSRRARREG